MTDLNPSHPEFQVALRGYDREQVDEYINRLRTLLQDAERRARDAEASRVFAQAAEVSPRIAQIFELAEAEARDLKRQALAEHQVLIEQLEQSRERIRAEVSDLEARRNAVVAELRRLGEVLAGAAGDGADDQQTEVLELAAPEDEHGAAVVDDDDEVVDGEIDSVDPSGTTAA